MERKESGDVKKTLEDIRKETGLSLSLLDSELSDEETVKKLNEILGRAKGGEDKNFFIKQFLLGQKSRGEIVDFMRKYHMESSTKAVLLLVCFKQDIVLYDVNVLSGFFETNTAQIIWMGEKDIAIILTDRKRDSEDTLFELSSAICDIINTECIKDAKVFFDSARNTIFDIPDAYKNLLLTKDIAEAFYSPAKVYSFHKLGIKKLLYRLPAEACAEYLRDTVPGFDFRKLDPDLKNTIQAFIDSDLSVAETSRRTYVHRNTLNYRLDKFEKLSGLNIRHFDDAMLCRIGMMISEIV